MMLFYEAYNNIKRKNINKQEFFFLLQQNNRKLTDYYPASL